MPLSHVTLPMFTEITMAASKYFRFKEVRRTVFSISLTLFWLSSLGQATALGSFKDKSGPDSRLLLKSFSEGSDIETRGLPADKVDIAEYWREVDDHQRHELSREKRDLQEIITQQNMTFPPEIVRLTRVALQNIQQVTTSIKDFIENPPVDGTTAAPEVNETTTTDLPGPTEPVNSTTTANLNETSTTTENSNAGNTTTTTLKPTSMNPPPTSLPEVGTTNTTTTTTTPTTTTTTGSTRTSPANTSAIFPTVPGIITRDPDASNIGNDSLEATRSVSRKIEISGRNLFFERSISGFSAQVRAREQPGKKTSFSVSEIIVTLQIALNASERVMMDKLSAETLAVLEESFESLSLINKSMPVLDNFYEEKEKLLFWINYLLLSVKHSLQKMKDDENASWLLGKTGDITIVITAAFCVLAIILAGGLFAYSFKSRKEKCGNYKIDKAPQKSNLRSNPGRSQTSSIDQSAGDPNSFFSIPSGVTVQTRSNPMYSSHRSVDVERVPTVQPIEKHRNEESRSEESSRTAGDRSANGRDRKAVSPSSNSAVTSFREQGRSKDRKYDAAKDNEGFLDDDGVRSDSESVL